MTEQGDPAADGVPPRSGPIRVVLVDDDPLVRAGLAMILRGAPHVEIVGEAGDGVEGLVVIDETRPTSS